MALNYNNWSVNMDMNIVIIVLGGLVSYLLLLPKKKKKTKDASTINPFAQSTRLSGKVIDELNKKGE